MARRNPPGLIRVDPSSETSRSTSDGQSEVAVEDFSTLRNGLRAMFG